MQKDESTEWRSSQQTVEWKFVANQKNLKFNRRVSRPLQLEINFKSLSKKSILLETKIDEIF